MRLCKKPLRHRDYVYKLHPVEPYHDNCPCTGHQVVDWVGEQIDDAQETVEDVRNWAREILKAITSQDGLSIGGGHKGDGSEVTTRLRLIPPTDLRPNNPRPVPGRPDSVIATTPLGGVTVPYLGGIEINKRHAVPIP